MLKIASVGQKINNISTNIDFCSRESLSPYDIIVFKPFISETDTAAYPIEALSRFCEHWKTELKIAREADKLLFILLPMKTVANVQRSTINLADVVDRLPRKRIVVGKDIRVAKRKELNIFLELCKIFPDTGYEYVFIDLCGEDEAVLLNNSECPVCVLRHNDYPYSDGYVVFCQDLYKNVDAIQGKNVDGRFCQWLIKLYGVLKPNKNAVQNIPYWVEDEQYKTIEEQNCEKQMQQCELQIAELDMKKETLKEQKQELCKLKSLLYAYDKQLENAVNQALNLLGVDAKEYDNKDMQLQIDTEFKMEDLVVLGETKGHTGFANNDDINQLIANSLQYFSEVCSEEAEVPKKILFLNSEREKEISERNRDNCCSSKVLKLAKSDKVAIVWTPDLFTVAKYVSDTKNMTFAKNCINAIINTENGLVKFPSILKSM